MKFPCNRTLVIDRINNHEYVHLHNFIFLTLNLDMKTYYLSAGKSYCTRFVARKVGDTGMCDMSMFEN